MMDRSLQIPTSYGCFKLVSHRTPLEADAWWELSVHLPHGMKDVLTHWVIYCNESQYPEEGSLSCRLAPLRLDKALSVKDMGKLPLNLVI